MLYHFYELQHTMLAPWRMMAIQQERFFRNSMNPLSRTQFGRMMAAAADVFEHSTRRYGKPLFGLWTTMIDGEEVEVTEETVLREPFCKLKHFKRDTARNDPRVLVVAPLSGHYATLLRGTVEELLPDHEVYITDWRDARDVPLSEGTFDLDDYVDYIIRFLHFLGPNTHVLAVCQPGVPVFAATSLLSERNDPCVPTTLTMMGSPIDVRQNPTAVNQLAEDHSLDWFENNVIMRVPFPNKGAMRKVYPGFLQLAGFMQMNLDNHVNAHRDMFNFLVEGDEDGAEKKKEFYEEYRSVMDMTAEFYLQTIDVVFIQNLLPKGQWVSKGRKVDPSKITKTVVTAVEGERDDITGIGQTRAALDLATNLPKNQKHLMVVPGAGHYGIFNGSKWRSYVAPRLRKIIRQNDAMKSKLDPMKIVPTEEGSDLADAAE